MYYRILATLAFSFILYVGKSQISYHRLYETTLNDQMGMNDTIFYHMNSTTTSGDVYAMGTKRVGNDDLTVIFTKHSDKGNIDWSKELDLGQDTVDIQGIGNFEFNGTQDSILFVIDAEINGQRKEIFGKLAASGADIALRTVGGNQFATLNNIPNVAPFINQSDLLLTPGVQPTISRIGLGDNLIWSRSYEFINTNGDPVQNFVTDIKSTADSTIVLTGTTEGEEVFMAAELDSNGVQIWAESYTFSIPDLTRILPTAITPLSNGNFVVAGDYVTNGTLTNGFVAVVDTAGAVLMAKKLFVTENFSSIRNLTEAADMTIWMSGVYSNGDTTKYFTTNMDLAGIINWTTIYGDEACVSDHFTTSLINNQTTGGASLVGNGFIDDLQVLQVMKHDVDGTTPCSDTLTIITEDLTLSEDTLTSNAINGGIFFDSLDFELNTFVGFTPPTLTVTEYPPFCPNEVIDTFLVASVSGVADENISYEWSTGEFTDTIGVMMEGMYSVTVTITEDVCYTMCDTVELTRLTLPDVAITLDTSRYCEDRTIILNTDYTPGATIQSYLWNNMATTPSIEVTELGIYSVTVTDECGEMAEAALDISMIDVNPTVSIIQGLCVNGQTTLAAIYDGFGMAPQYIWSTNETTPNISVSTEGVYTVTVTDECGGDPATAEINYEFSNDLELNIFTANNFSTLCDENNPNNGLELNAVLQPLGLNPTYSWSTGETGPTIYVTSNGEYTVTATDECGQMIVQSISVDDVKEIPDSGEITFELDCNEDDVALSRIIFNASANIDNAIIKLDIFNTEDVVVSQEVIPSEPLVLGSYLAILSTCDDVELATITVNAEILCGGVLRYPIAFFPGGEDEDSRTFGPIPSDTMNLDRITDVEFKVFNRWGETVFESNAILEAWDGTHKGDPAPSEVYIWYVSYLIDGQLMLDKGDVTLLR